MKISKLRKYLTYFIIIAGNMTGLCLGAYFVFDKPLPIIDLALFFVVWFCIAFISGVSGILIICWPTKEKREFAGELKAEQVEILREKARTRFEEKIKEKEEEEND